MLHDKEERKLQKVKISIMRRKEFAAWHGLLMVGTTSVDDNFPTAATNGRDDWYGRAFVKQLSEKELTFVVLHEALHKAFRHLTTWSKLAKENMPLANAAMDYVINLVLVDQDPNETHLAFPRNKDGSRMGLYDTRFRGMHTKQVYDILKQEQQDGGGGKGKGKGDGDGGSGLGQGFDEHDWDGAAELTEEEKKTLEREVDQAIRQGQMQDAKLNGDRAGNASRVLGELLSPKIDWREALREFVTSTCSAKDASSWRRVNRRFLSSGVYMPSLIGERVGHLVVGVDTSGSISGREISRFLSEVKSIAEDVHPEKVDLIYWDAAVASHEEYDEATLSTLVESTKPAGGGGTDPRCVSKYLKEKVIQPECVIMLTDGYVGSWGDDWEAPIMWVVVGGNKSHATCGKTIHVED